MGVVVVVGALIAVLAAFIVVVVMDMRSGASGGPPAGVEDIEVGSAGQHTEGDVEYAQNPPAGGEHASTWQNAGFYSEPVREENAVHTLEHGAVWISYSPDLPGEQIENIRGLVEDQTCLLASPREDLPSPVVASAWGKQLQLDSADDPALERFILAYRQGPQTPEPGASCTGGVGTPG